MFVKLALVCMAPIIINNTDSWTPRDSEVVKEAAKRCEINYPAAPCVKYFIKKAELDYHVICGAPEPEEREGVEIQ
jgi:hypothetical protein